MELIYQHDISEKNDIDHRRSVNLFCVLKNEAILLPYFLDYYKQFGVTHFYLIDNDSSDSSIAYIKSRQDINCHLFSQKHGFTESRFGTDWINELTQNYCQNEYCIRVDIDELLVLHPDFPNIQHLIEHMETTGTNTCAATLVDIYPYQLNNDYKAGMPFENHSYYFDDLNTEFYQIKGRLYQTAYWIDGGMRARTTQTFNTIQKFPIYKYVFNDNTAKPGIHFFYYNRQWLPEAPLVKLVEKPMVILHYKFLKPDFVGYLKEQVHLKTHWNDASEYKKYLTAFENNPHAILFDKKYSRTYEQPRDLEKFWNLFVLINS